MRRGYGRWLLLVNMKIHDVGLGFSKIANFVGGGAPIIFLRRWGRGRGLPVCDRQQTGAQAGADKARHT
jgi:hypothetical protein